MKKKWREITNTFFSFQRSDRNAIVTLAILIVVVFMGVIALNHMPLKQDNDFSEIKALVKTWEKKAVTRELDLKLRDFDPNTISGAELDSLPIPSIVKYNILQYRKAGGTFKTAKDVRKIYGMNDSVFVQIKDYIKIREKKDVVKKIKPVNHIVSEKLMGSIDPNTAAYEELVKYGFNKFQTNNLIKYRKSGGYFNEATDLLKIYGIDSVFYTTISAYIHIQKPKIEPKPVNVKNLRIELNSVDTTDLMELPGIGTTLAGRIIKYRDLLGGYYSKHQLLEVYKLSEETYSQIQGSIYADTLTLSKVRINFAEYSDLIKHPYMGTIEVNKILDYRQKNGPIKNIEVLCNIEGFDSEFITKISPYITCQ